MKETETNRHAGTLADAYSILHGLLLSIPTFWGSKELAQVIMLYTEQSLSSPNTSLTLMLSLVKTIAKKVPSKVLLPAMVDIWPTIQVAPQSV